MCVRVFHHVLYKNSILIDLLILLFFSPMILGNLFVHAFSVSVNAFILLFILYVYELHNILMQDMYGNIQYG